MIIKLIIFSGLLLVYQMTVAQTQVVKEQWVRRFNGTADGPAEARSLDIDDKGNIYVTGERALSERATIISQLDTTLMERKHGLRGLTSVRVITLPTILL